MQAWFLALLNWYFGILDNFGVAGVVVMMALAVPSELVIPPVAYVEVYKESPNFGTAVLISLAITLAGAIGFCISTTFIYWLSRGFGRPLIVKYGKYILIPEKKLKLAEEWIERYGAAGIMLGALLPGIRHIICIPAGIAKMRFRTFTIMAFIGSAIWSAVLTIFGLIMSKDMAAMVGGGIKGETVGYKHAFTNLTLGTIALVALVAVLYMILLRRKRVPAGEVSTSLPTQP